MNFDCPFGSADIYVSPFNWVFFILGIACVTLGFVFAVLAHHAWRRHIAEKIQ